MNTLVELFRENPEGSRFDTFQNHPMNSPGCPEAEPRYRTILTHGILNRALQLTDPKYPESILAGIVRKSILLPFDWFTIEQTISTHVLAKHLWSDTTPPNDDAIRPVAISALALINTTLFICRSSDKHQSKFIVHRPIISLGEQQILLQLLQSQFPNVFQNVNASTVW